MWRDGNRVGVRLRFNCIFRHNGTPVPKDAPSHAPCCGAIGNQVFNCALAPKWVVLLGFGRCLFGGLPHLCRRERFDSDTSPSDGFVKALVSMALEFRTSPDWILHYRLSHLGSRVNTFTLTISKAVALGDYVMTILYFSPCLSPIGLRLAGIKYCHYDLLLDGFKALRIAYKRRRNTIIKFVSAPNSSHWMAWSLFVFVFAAIFETFSVAVSCRNVRPASEEHPFGRSVFDLVGRAELLPFR